MKNLSLKDYILNNWNYDATAIEKETTELFLDDSKADRILLKDFIDRYTRCTIEEFSFNDVLSAFFINKDVIKSDNLSNNFKKKSGSEKRKLLLKLYGNIESDDDSDDYLNY